MIMCEEICSKPESTSQISVWGGLVSILQHLFKFFVIPLFWTGLQASQFVWKIKGFH
jgi:hypothetical protein